jgi:hypothetical protein
MKPYQGQDNSVELDQQGRKNTLTTPGVALRVNRAERIVVLIDTPEGGYKVMQLMFEKKGGFFVNLAYHARVEGLLGAYTLPAGRSSELNLEHGGYTTVNRVKYSHHADGNAHFSQDRKIYTTVRKQSVPLLHARGHMFTLQLQGLENFERATEKDRNPGTIKRETLRFLFSDRVPQALKIVGRWYGEQNYLQVFADAPPGEYGPVVAMRTPEGANIDAMAVSPPVGNPFDRCVMLLSCHEVPMIEGRDPYLLFVGGFDASEDALDISRATSALFLQYGIEPFEDLRQQLGSLDYSPS